MTAQMDLVDREHTFPIEEMFFSTTDEKGVIGSTNAVFERVAGYGWDELVGRAHNVVRHPDMPRAVFQLLWDEIGAGRSLAAYVKNRSHDGGFYWVMATVVPIPGGYLSVRLKPTTGFLAAARGLYAELRTLELGIESGDGKARKRAIEASLPLLHARIRELGFTDYADFMRTALAAELAAREAARTRRPAEHGGSAPLEQLAAATARVLGTLDGLFANLSGYTDLNRRLGAKSGFVGELASSIRLFSLNALIAATRLGQDGVALSAVADMMGRRSVQVGTILGSLTGSIDAAVELLSRLVFEVSVCKLQAEMTVEFAHELLAHEADERRGQREADVAMLVATVEREVQALLGSLATLDETLTQVARGSGALASQLDVLQALQMNGRIEAAVLGGAVEVEALFAQIREKLDEALRETREVVSLARDARADGESRRRLDQGVAAMAATVPAAA